MSIIRSELSELTDKALQNVNEMLKQTPELKLQGIRNQLESIQKDVQSGVVPSDEMKQRINIGIVAVREFEASDPEFADTLMKISYLYKNKL